MCSAWSALNRGLRDQPVAVVVTALVDREAVQHRDTRSRMSAEDPVFEMAAVVVTHVLLCDAEQAEQPRTFYDIQRCRRIDTVAVTDREGERISVNVHAQAVQHILSVFGNVDRGRIPVLIQTGAHQVLQISEV